jgi:hypothetical protein
LVGLLETHLDISLLTHSLSGLCVCVCVCVCAVYSEIHFDVHVNREAGPEDVVFKVLYCGMDHTDLHQMRNEIHSTNYPLVPGYAPFCIQYIRS